MDVWRQEEGVIYEEKKLSYLFMEGGEKVIVEGHQKRKR